MRSTVARVAVGIAAVVVAVLLLVVLKDDGEGGNEPAPAPAPATTTGSTPGKDTSPSAGTEIPTIVVEGGEPVGGVKELDFDEGDRIRFKVKSDVSDEIHVHGYDLMKDVEAGGSVTFDFPATIEGVFEAELEERKQPIAELTVNP